MEPSVYRKARVLGLGQWLPETVRTNDAWPAEFIAAAQAPTTDRTIVHVPAGDNDDPCARVGARFAATEAGDPFSGAIRRRVADPSMTTHAAETMAARAAIGEAGIDPADIGLVVSWELVPERVSHPSAPRVAHAVGARRALAVGMDAACSSAITQLSYAASMVETGRARYALLTQSHLVTRVVSPTKTVSPTMGDMATAMVVGMGPGHELVGSHAITHGELVDAVVWQRRGEDTPWYTAGMAFDIGTRDRRATEQVIRDVVRIGSQTVQELLDASGVDRSELAALITVQPRRWLSAAIAEILGLPPERAPTTFDELAHVGGCAVVANLIEARARGLLAAGDLVALYAQGAGFTRAAALLRWQAPD